MTFSDPDPRAATYPPGDPSSWYHVAWSDQVTSRAPLAVEALGESFVLFRDGAGQVVVLDRYCPHLGADLAAGRTCAGAIECPFHRWRFDADGRLCHVPVALDRLPPVHTRRWAAQELGGMVFVWRSQGGRREEPRWDDVLGGSLAGLRPVGRRVVRDVRMHLIELVENTVDDQHFAPLHSQMCLPWTRVPVPGLTIHHDTRWIRDGEPEWIVRFTDDAHLRLAGRALPRSGAFATVTFVGPGAVVRLAFDVPDLGRVVLVQTQTPLAPLRQRVSFRWFAERQIPGFLATYIVGAWYSQWLADVAIWQRKVYLERPQLIAADGPVHALRRWYRQFYADGEAA